MPAIKIKKCLSELEIEKEKLPLHEIESRLLEISTILTCNMGRIKNTHFEEISEMYLSLKNWLDNQQKI